jgi:hypothetical protein
MNLSMTRLAACGCTVLLTFTSLAAQVQAVAIVATREDNALHTNTGSAFFTSTSDGTTLVPEGGWAPLNPVVSGGAGATSTTPKKSYSITGNSTLAGADFTPGTDDDWLDGNKIPTGLTLAFDAQFTVTALPAGSILTTPGFSGGPLGRGIGVTQVVGGANDINTGNGLEVSAVTIANVNFTGTLTEPGYAFTPGTVSGYGAISLRSNNFQETEIGADGLLLTQGDETIGFGTATGTLASHLVMDNNFGPPGTTSEFPRRLAPFTLIVTEGNAVIKGIGFQYDVTYDVAPVVAGVNADFDGDSDVDGQDFLIWQRNVGVTSGGTREQGNANPETDGAIDGTDLEVWRSQFGTLAGAEVSAVPEPATLLLTALAAAAMLSAGRTGRR